MHVLVALVALASVALVTPALAQPAPPLAPQPPQAAASSSLAFQIGGGYLSGGTAFVEDVEVNVQGGPLGTLAIDSIVSPRLSLGLFVVGAQARVEGLDVRIGTVGGTIKSRFGSPTGTQLRVGVAFGYQTIDVDDADSETIKGFDIAPIIEVAFPTSGSLALVLQASALSQPVGGNADVEVTFAPIGYVGAVLEIRN